MELRFIQQRTQGAITVFDEVELVNCDRDDGGYQNGEYTVADVEEDGAVTLVGKGRLSGHIAVVNL
jgi:hypothetical protein